MNTKEFAKELLLFYRTGEQDAGNVMDPNELLEDIGPLPTKTQIKAWLLEQGTELLDWEASLEFPEEATEAQQWKLLEEWAAGWASYAFSYMKIALEERVEKRVFHEPPGGLLEDGWYVYMEFGANLGPFRTEAEATKKAFKVEEEQEDRSPRY